MYRQIKITGASQNNLKNISLEIPHYKLIAVTGVSGSGKSSLAFDTIAGEGQREYLESIPSFARQFAGKVSKPDVKEISGLFPVITISQRTTGSSSKSTVGTLSEIYDLLRLLFARFGKSENNIKLSRSLFSFNSPLGACPVCAGLGVEEKISVEKLVADPNKTLREGALVPTLPNGYIMYSQVTVDVLNTVCGQHGFNVDIPWKQLSEEQKDVILNGSEKIKVLYGKHSLESRLKWTGLKAKPREEGYYKGMLKIMEDILKRDRNKNILRFTESVKCGTCAGKRLNEKALSVYYRNYTIDYLSDLELSELAEIFREIKPASEAEEKIILKIIHQLNLLRNLGVGHLKLSRGSNTLTGGEMQRIKLVNQLSAELSNVLYVFDEPSIGLHPRDNHQMISVLRELVNNGNTVIVIEHDLEIIRNSDWILEIGPEAGSNGGELLYNGSTQEFLEYKSPGGLTPTQKALMGIEKKYEPKTNGEDFVLSDCSVNNLKGFNVTFKKYSLNAVTGVSGSGKASLVFGCLVPRLKYVIKIDQSPIGRTPRSNPATYTGLADNIRDLFAQQEEAIKLGYKKGRFSFNNKGGRCETCEGAGKIQIGMHYMGNVDVICETCGGKRFNDETLQIKYKGKNISDVYDMSINEAHDFFVNEDKIRNYLSVLKSLDLGYLKLGQASTTLSGGEAQRIKLAESLVKKTRQDTWFILDEPTTGLHYQDTQYLIAALRKLTEQGNTVVYIEHQEQLIKTSDWIIDLGPESGSKGGELIFQGTWNDFAECEKSLTATAMINNYVETFVYDKKKNNIKLTNVTTNNLKSINIEFPKNKITVLTGLSGSGKSSLAFDTLYAESQSRFTESLSTYTRSFIKQSNNAKADSFENLTPAVAINRKNLPVTPRSTVGTMTGINEKYRYMYSRIAQLNNIPLTARAFSGNDESGACRKCSGLGQKLTADKFKLAPDWNISIPGGALTHNSTIRYYGNPDSQFVALLNEAAKNTGIDLKLPLNQFTDEELKIIFYGTGKKVWDTVWHYKTKTGSGTKNISGLWKGFCNLIDEEYVRRLHNKNLEALLSMMHETECEDCKGAGLNEQSLSIKIDNKNIYALSSMSIKETMEWFEKFSKKNNVTKIVETIYEQIKSSLSGLVELELGHLSLTRRSSTLSGGEGQRLRLAQQLSGGLTGLTYILDEPTIGLHPSNVTQLLKLIRELKEKGNTIVIVEHDREVIKSADHIIEIGPGSGNDGGKIIASGNYEEFIQNDKAITPEYLTSHKLPELRKRNIIHNSFGLRGVTKHNLVNRDFNFISGGIIAVTGQSGAGKSTLIHHVLEPTLKSNSPVNCSSFYNNSNFDQVILVDHRALPGTKIGTVATYANLLEYLQLLFSNTEDAIQSGLKKSSFSYNNKEGKCPVCNGLGQIKISMDFMDDVWNTCDECSGTRYNEAVLKVKYHNRNIADFLSMTVSEILQFFSEHKNKFLVKTIPFLILLKEIGLGHLRLDQSTSSLSGGESQRLKLTVNLFDVKRENVLFLFDEPTSGLHYKDIDELIKVFNRMVDEGHTIVFIEHNSYLINVANQIIEM